MKEKMKSRRWKRSIRKSELNDSECGWSCGAFAQDHKANGMKRRSADLEGGGRRCRADGSSRRKEERMSKALAI